MSLNIRSTSMADFASAGSDRYSARASWVWPSNEFKDKAVRLAEELVELEGCSKWAAEGGCQEVCV